MDRRAFLRLTAALPALLAPWPAAAAARWDRVLVLVELAGGNDGLNTVAPVRDPLYRRLRPRLAIPADEALAIDETLGLHPALEPLMPLWADGRVAVALGVGYPDPNLSHFRSIEIWDTASDSHDFRADGWVARLFAAEPPPAEAAVDGVVLGRGDAGPLAGPSARTVVLAGGDERLLGRAARRPAVAAEAPNAALAHVLAVKARLSEAAEAILSSRVADVDPGAAFPSTGFGRQMEGAARLIAAGVRAPAIKVSLGSFDTHAGQSGQHARLLAELAGGLAAFAAAAKAKGFWDRVLVVTYSEFGRRPAENGSAGTDHGTAAPHFLLGGRVRGGLYGAQPPLHRLQDGNLTHTTHFRTLYATVARDWWGLDAADLAEPALGCIA